MGETGRRHVNIHKQTSRALTDKRRKLRATSDRTRTKYRVLFLRYSTIDTIVYVKKKRINLKSTQK